MQRRDLLKLISFSGAIALVPMGVLTLFSKSAKSTSSTFLNEIVIHAPKGKIGAVAYPELESWVNASVYKQLLERFQNEGRLIRYSTQMMNPPFRVELEFRSLEDRALLLKEFATYGVVNEARRDQLGYKVTEDVREISPQQIVLRTHRVRTIA